MLTCKTCPSARCILNGFVNRKTVSLRRRQTISPPRQMKQIQIPPTYHLWREGLKFVLRSLNIESKFRNKYTNFKHNSVDSKTNEWYSRTQDFSDEKIFKDM